MTATEDNLEQALRNSEEVHVVRHSFRPNEPLQALLAGFVLNGPHEARSFTVYGTDERIIERDDMIGNSFNTEMSRADTAHQKHINEHHVIIQLDKQVEARLLQSQKRGSLALQLIMKPENLAEYAALLPSLNEITLGRRGYTPELTGAQLYVNLSVSHEEGAAKETRKRLKELRDLFSNDSVRRLYQLRPNDHLAGEFVPLVSRLLPKPKSGTETEPTTESDSEHEPEPIVEPSPDATIYPAEFPETKAS